jgi:predicted phage terminase large subunit-like protein
MADPPIIWRPNPGPQTQFLASSADEVLFGGASGGGKSAAIIAMGLRWAHVPAFRGLILRRETTQLQDLLDKSRALYPKVFPGVTFNANANTWTFPSGARIRFNHCKEESDKYDYQGQEFQLVVFDELTHFTSTQYLEIASRIRSASAGLPRYLRATSNPGGHGHEWVLKRFGAWLNPDFEAPGLAPRFGPTGERLPPVAPGEKRWVLATKNDGEVYVPPGTPDALSRQFIPALLKDNPRLLENDPTYQVKIMQMDPVRRAQLLDGDWLVKPGAGLYFKRSWVHWLDAPPDGLRWVRAWDLAATPKTDHNDPAWTAGVKIARWVRPEGVAYVIADARRTRAAPGHRDAFILDTAQGDGRTTRIALPQDPGQAGVDQVAAFKRLLAGYGMLFLRPSADKVERFAPFSAQASPPCQIVYLVRGAWNDAYLSELEEFPDGSKKDQADATADGFAVVAADPMPTTGRAHGLGQRRGLDGF